MKIFGICLVKNEADIIEEVLIKASKWCDYILVYDNGSTDNTWLIVNDLAKDYPQVIPYKTKIQPYTDNLRNEVFNAYRHLSNEGDWWCKLDADEVYFDNPRNLLTRIPRHHHVVFNQSYQFYFTDVDLEEWKKNPDRYEKCKDYEALLSYYKCNWSEIRFFKYRKKLIWDSNSSWPKHIGIVAKERIKLKHYQFRSPKQIQDRLIQRQLAVSQGHNVFAAYYSESSWEEKIQKASELNHVSEGWVVDEKILPYHIEPFHKRFLKYLLHFIHIFP